MENIRFYFPNDGDKEHKEKVAYITEYLDEFSEVKHKEEKKNCECSRGLDGNQ